jgi:hypothetical protein
MPGDPEECRRHALRCVELAETAESPDAKARFQHLAEHWLQLAEELEATLSFAKALEDEPLKKRLKPEP